MDGLRSKPAGVRNDKDFIKTAAVNLFGSATLLNVGVVKGITVKGVKKKGLNPVALEGIRGEFKSFDTYEFSCQKKGFYTLIFLGYQFKLYGSTLLLSSRVERGKRHPTQPYPIITASLLQFTKIIGYVAFASLRYRSARLSPSLMPLNSRRPYGRREERGIRLGDRIVR